MIAATQNSRRRPSTRRTKSRRPNRSRMNSAKFAPRFNTRKLCRSSNEQVERTNSRRRSRLPFSDPRRVGRRRSSGLRDVHATATTAFASTFGTYTSTPERAFVGQAIQTSPIRPSRRRSIARPRHTSRPSLRPGPRHAQNTAAALIRRPLAPGSAQSSFLFSPRRGRVLDHGGHSDGISSRPDLRSNYRRTLGDAASRNMVNGRGRPRLSDMPTVEQPT